ncbi:MAG: D-alanyl-D-alanine carboxypeptidase family protein [Lachnospiraceae bacterium]|nr:D-alanyl-D-alanine carboxypeptidase family protein [Lachnospiraceae bacterium]
MQKIISYFLLFFSLLLLFLVTTRSLNSSLRTYPPFSNIKQTKAIATKKISGSSYVKKQDITLSSLNAKACCLMDAATGRVLYGKQEDKKLPMASTTKIMTCILALENAKGNDRIPVSSYAASMPDVQLNMQTGDTFYLKDLLYSLMLESHNDTAVAIAEAIGGSVKGFAAMMNQKASELGCTRTHFVTPNGLDDKKHYTTAKELCTIARYAMQNKTFRQIIQTKSHSFSNCDNTRQYRVYNHDAFLSSYAGALGIKTGFTNRAGYCFAGAAKKDGRMLLSSVLACGWPPHKTYKWNDTKALMDYGFSHFQNVTVPIPSYDPVIPIQNAVKNSLLLTSSIPSKITYPLSYDDTLTIQRKIPKKLSAPIRQGDIIGYDTISLNRSILEKYPIIAKETIRSRSFSYFAKLLLQCFFFNSLA